MTRQYVAGELSLLLAQLQAVAERSGVATEIAMLRRDAETLPMCALASIAVRAMRLTDALCWESLSRGDIAAFSGQAAAAAELLEFAVCAGLLGEDC